MGRQDGTETAALRRLSWSCGVEKLKRQVPTSLSDESTDGIFAYHSRSHEIIMQNLNGNPATSRLQLIHFPSALGFDEGQPLFAVGETPYGVSR